ncbi:peptide-N(4)-(N-acetyl-beta-glucosaminyl)asparagine amidase [Phalaenopsis equestris]|uniref:peptide-N(4)-(N-acetyl-beta- glucosaminyl)asparagine amidase n=1 Tax=Phalaenopsis equestris TaxID=78828 RepID=UPI0009E5CBDE|nr:peptide-N(4)-(N-acetyl-beta-glucosaminyl)asparagine amidase [Phalaenopsis equestris]
MVARRFVVHHNGTEFPIDYDTDDGLEVLKFQIFSVTSVPPDEQKLTTRDRDVVVTEESDLVEISEWLCLVSIDDGIQDKPESIQQLRQSDEELARMLQAEEEALFFRHFQAIEGTKEFEQRVRPYVNRVLLYEDPVRQEAARKSVPLAEIQEKSLVSLAKEGIFKPSKDEEDHSFLLQLLLWFKQSFSWVNSPSCDNCGRATSNIGMGAPLPFETKFEASRVELYRCNYCSCITRFPRYNDPLKLLETRRGRCGEWANCFTLYCRAFGYEARLILDFTDHVWTECFSQLLGRWMHLDPCEGIYDKPLLYEKGWNKKLNYVIAIAKDGVRDVTKRYTRKWTEVLSRRNIATESSASSVLSSLTKELRSGFSSELLEVRDMKELEELESGLHNMVDSSLYLPGRQSGDVEWRMARHELGSNEQNSLSFSLCPVRKCIDTHVTSIYNAFALLLSFQHENAISKDEAIEALQMLKSLFLDLRAAPFKERKTFLSSTLRLSEEVMFFLEELFTAVSLKDQMGSDGRLCVALANDPVQTSLALPVALDVVDEIIENFGIEVHCGKVASQFPRFDRISSGFVLASGEELPFGIGTSAFDGSRLTKWEEPNGAKGCWLLYKVANNQRLDLESYDVMSANDAPERDPVEWIVEGSNDGGLSWNVLDKRSSQLFEKRFQRRSFRVETRYLCNEFRFSFLSVRDPNATSRFQIGSIDLYCKGSS